MTDDSGKGTKGMVGDTQLHSDHYKVQLSGIACVCLLAQLFKDHPEIYTKYCMNFI